MEFFKSGHTTSLHRKKKIRQLIGRFLLPLIFNQSLGVFLHREDNNNSWLVAPLHCIIFFTPSTTEINHYSANSVFHLSKNLALNLSDLYQSSLHHMAKRKRGVWLISLLFFSFENYSEIFLTGYRLRSFSSRRNKIE